MKLGTRGRLLVGRNVDGKRNAQKSNCLAIGEHGGWNTGMAMLMSGVSGAVRSRNPVQLDVFNILEEFLDL